MVRARPYRQSAIGALMLAVGALGMADAQERGAVLGVRVRDATDGSPLRDVIVHVHGTGLATQTDSAGQAHITGVPEGIHLVGVRRIGYTPRTAGVVLLDGQTSDIALSLAPIPAHLRAVPAVAATYYAPWLVEFEQRRARGVGRFITEREIRAANGSDLGLLLMARVPGVRITGRGAGRYVYSLRGPSSITGGCQAAVYLDGVRVPDGDAGEVSLNQLGGIEFYGASTAPPRYREPGLKLDGDMPRGGSAACGVLLLWTRP